MVCLDYDIPGRRVSLIRDGRIMVASIYVEWHSPIIYVLPGLHSLTGGYR